MAIDQRAPKFYAKEIFKLTVGKFKSTGALENNADFGGQQLRGGW